MKTEFSNNSTDAYKTDAPPEEGAIVETSVQARQGFLGRPVLVVLCVSLALAIGTGAVMLIWEWVVP